jgi:hypothetical protein
VADRVTRTFFVERGSWVRGGDEDAFRSGVGREQGENPRAQFHVAMACAIDEGGPLVRRSGDGIGKQSFFPRRDAAHGGGGGWGAVKRRSEGWNFSSAQATSETFSPCRDAEAHGYAETV